MIAVRVEDCSAEAYNVWRFSPRTENILWCFKGSEQEALSEAERIIKEREQTRED